MIINSETLVILVQRTQLSEEGKVLSWVLNKIREIILINFQPSKLLFFVIHTFCACWAIINTSEKSYIPRAVSNSRSASTRKIMYLTASSTISGLESVRKKKVRFTYTYIYIFDFTSQTKEKSQASLVVGWSFDHMRCKDRINIFC